jgi:hypothetical protein
MPEYEIHPPLPGDEPPGHPHGWWVDAFYDDAGRLGYVIGCEDEYVATVAPESLSSILRAAVHALPPDERLAVLANVAASHGLGACVLASDTPETTQ